MDRCNQTFKRGSSAKCRPKPKPLQAAYSEVAEDHSASLSDGFRLAQTKANSRSSEIVSTSDVVSAVGQIWECTNRSLGYLQRKRNSSPTYTCSHRDNLVCKLGEKEGSRQCGSDENVSVCYSLKPVQQSSENPIPAEVAPSKSLSEKFWRNKKDVFTLLEKSWNRSASSALGVSYDFKIMYGWMNWVSLCTVRQHATTIHEYEKTIEGYMQLHRTKVSVSFPGFKTNISNGLGNVSSDVSSDIQKELAARDNETASRNNMSISSLYSDYFLQVIGEPQREVGASVVSCSGLHVESLADSTTLGHTFDLSDGGSVNADDALPDNKCNIGQCLKLDGTVQQEVEMSLVRVSKHNHALAKQEHAFSGALAGTFVSLCLHPVDTMKTVIQSCRADQRSLYIVGQSIISERGVTGLYRGIASNIATSAPISAIYTFSYETVKGLLLPYLPKDYHSLAHCTAGGCASVATSFIFTPSERIKQQMQVSPRYQNCWNAFLRIIQNGGLSSLYTGWRAVLCRNIPHSMIKFHTYESLKQHFLSSDRPSAYQTLLCGGLAGSTAALFSTPFDVVKTRYQTQAPGSAKQYSGVLSAITEISKSEGSKGLYRGLTPRIVMYMTQGALFFTSYEFFKGLF